MKKEIRKKYIEIRKQIKNKEDKSKNIINKIINHQKYKEAKVVACYCSLKDEVCLDELIIHAWENEKVVVVVNRGEKKTELQIPVWRAEVPMQAEMEQVLYTWEEGYSSDRVMFPVDEGKLSIEMGKNSAAILRFKGKKYLPYAIESDTHL